MNYKKILIISFLIGFIISIIPNKKEIIYSFLYFLYKNKEVVVIMLSLITTIFNIAFTIYMSFYSKNKLKDKIN